MPQKSSHYKFTVVNNLIDCSQLFTATINLSTMANYHVSKSNSGWKAQQAGASRAAGHYPTQEKAEKAAKQFSANSGGGEVRIHSRQGTIRDSDTVAPGNDPYPPKDTKN